MPTAFLGTLKATDVTNARTVIAQRDLRVELNVSYCFKLTNFKILVYFNNIGLVQQLIERLMTLFQEL